MLSELEQRRARELHFQVANLAENQTLKHAVANYAIEADAETATYRSGMITGIRRELNSIAARTAADVLAIADTDGRVLAVAGRRHADWPLDTHIQPAQTESGTEYVSIDSGVFQFASVPLTLQNRTIGTLQLAKALDGRYASELSTAVGGGDAHRLGRAPRRDDAAGRPGAGADAGVAANPADERDRDPRRIRVRGKAALPRRRRPRLRARFHRRVHPRADGEAHPDDAPIALVLVRARGSRERVAGADDLAADRHAVEVVVGDDESARLRRSVRPSGFSLEVDTLTARSTR